MKNSQSRVRNSLSSTTWSSSDNWSPALGKESSLCESVDVTLAREDGMSLGPTKLFSGELSMEMWGLVDIAGIILGSEDGLNQRQGPPSWVAKQASRWQAWVEQDLGREVLGRGGAGCKLHVLQPWGDKSPEELAETRSRVRKLLQLASSHWMVLNLYSDKVNEAGAARGGG